MSEKTEYCSASCIQKETISRSNVNCSDERDWNPLFDAVLRNHNFETISSIIKFGVDVNSRDSTGRSVLMYMQCFCVNELRCRKKRMIDMIIDHVYNLKVVDIYGNNIVHASSCYYLIGLAMRGGVSIEAKNKEGKSPLEVALQFDVFDKILYLLELGAEPNGLYLYMSTPFIALNYSKPVNDSNVIDLMLYYGADFNFLSNEKQTFEFVSKQTGFPVNSYNYIGRTLVRQFLLFINQSNVDKALESCNTDKDIVHSKPLKFYDQCCLDLNIMKVTFVKGNLSFYRFCNLMRFHYCKSIDIAYDEYQYDYEQIRELFPKFSDLIIMRIRDNRNKRFKRNLIRALEKIILKPTIKAFNETNVELFLNYDVMFNISKYLNHESLYLLFGASL